MDSEKEEEDSEGEPEPESRDGQPDPGGASGSVVESVPRLSKAQERDLRRVRKTDYSWLSSLVEA